MLGYAGRLLHVDLSSGAFRTQRLEESILGRFVGGRSLGAKLLYDMLPPGVDPFSPENVMLFLTGPVTGAPVPNAGKYVVVTKSPLTGAWLDSYASGYLALELKLAGYDGLIVRGRAPNPSYLWIEDERVELRDASHLWGKDCFESEDMVKAETSQEAGVMVIGPAGENLVRFACITSDHYRQAGRGGAGAVMGSKNLKAVAVRGTGSIRCADVAGLFSKLEADLARMKESKVAQARRKYGTPLTLNITNAAGMLPTRNFQTGTFPPATGRLDAEGVWRASVAGRACYGCICACSKVTRIEEGPYRGDMVEGPEYETLGLLGANLGIDYLPAVVRANIICDSLGMDTMSAGVVIGFAAECFGRGLISRSDLGYDLGFGKHDEVLALLEDIAFRKGFGRLLGEGVRRAAEAIGQGSERFAMHVKGMEFPAYDPRGAFGSGLAYAVSPRGACHRRAWPPAKEVLGNYPPFTSEGKAELVKQLYDENAILHSLLVCDFPFKFIPLAMEDYAEYLSLVTGKRWTSQELWTLADRAETQIRLFNNREGFSRSDDTLPGRICEEELPEGPPKGQRISGQDLERMLSEYYALRGWDSEGRPTAETLSALGLGGQE